MFKKLTNLFKEPESGKVKLSFIALDESDVPYEETATVPYSDGYDPAVIEAKFKNFMRLQKHLVVEVTILEKFPNPS
jgi:hypothetical protein